MIEDLTYLVVHKFGRWTLASSVVGSLRRLRQCAETTTTVQNELPRAPQYSSVVLHVPNRDVGVTIAAKLLRFRGK